MVRAMFPNFWHRHGAQWMHLSDHGRMKEIDRPADQVPNFRRGARPNQRRQEGEMQKHRVMRCTTHCVQHRKTWNVRYPRSAWSARHTQGQSKRSARSHGPQRGEGAMCGHWKHTWRINRDNIEEQECHSR